MSRLRIYPELDAATIAFDSTDHDQIARQLDAVGVRFERWETSSSIVPGDPPEKVIAAYQADIDRLMTEKGYRAVDVVSMHPEHPQKVELRKKFLDEHTHSEDEVRFFVAGQGLFSLHIGGKVYEVLCTRGDLIGVPDGTRHWFDMGPQPSFVAVRLFSNPAGWVANYSGDDIADRFPRLAA